MFCLRMLFLTGQMTIAETSIKWKLIRVILRYKTEGGDNITKSQQILREMNYRISLMSPLWLRLPDLQLEPGKYGDF